MKPSAPDLPAMNQELELKLSEDCRKELIHLNFADVPSNAYPRPMAKS